MTRFDAATPDERQKLFAEAIVAHRERGSPFVTFEADADAAATETAVGDDDAAEQETEAERENDAATGTEIEAPEESEGREESTGREENEESEGDAVAEESADAADPERAPPWIQFADGVLNLDCTDDELDDLKSVLGEFPAFKVDELTRPEDTDGVNVRVSALADQNRVAQCVERVFRDVYDQPESFRAWVTAV